MKTLINFAFLAIGLAFTAVSCTDKVEGESNIISVTLECHRQNLTKSGIEDKENIIEFIDYYLYPKWQTGSNALISGRKQVGGNGNSKVEIDLRPSDIEALFPGTENECDILVVANNSSTSSSQTSTSVSEILSQSLSTDFSKGLSSFVMWGEGTVSISRGDDEIFGRAPVTLKRAASKVSLQVCIADVIKVGDVEWIPQYEGITAALCNASSTATINGTVSDGPLFDYNTHTSIVGLNSEGAKMASFAPFYTYPQSWSAGNYVGNKWSPNESAPYFRISIPFSSEGRVKPFYYRVIPSSNAFESNNWYEERVNISILGSVSESSEDVVLNSDSFHIGNWNETISEAVEMYDHRFLTLLDNDIIMNNLGEVSVKYLSSHPVEVGSVKVTKTELYAAPKELPTYNVAVTSGYSTQVNELAKDVTFRHTLNNDFWHTTDYDISQFDIEITLRHKDDASVFSTLRLTQRPSLYITPEVNSCGLDNTKKGYVMVNNGTIRPASSDGSEQSLLGNSGVDNSTTNVARYKVRTSAIPQGCPFVVGDPRVKDVDNLLYKDGSKWSVTAPSVGGGNRTLTNYYPTGRGSNYDMMVSPEYMIASSYGAIHDASFNFTFKDAARRCASYQEDGYPAGRWRLPTYAESYFIGKLVHDKRIGGTYIFNSTQPGNYWCSSGYISIPFNFENVSLITDFSTSHLTGTRCVYDLWYWGEERVDKNTFTWGDKRR